jgi:hypothetical protein
MTEERWSVNFPMMTEKQANELASFITDGMGLFFAYVEDPSDWYHFKMDHESVRCIAAALKTATLDVCSETFLEGCEEWLLAYDALHPEGEAE